jgi:hypothetical protein
MATKQANKGAASRSTSDKEREGRTAGQSTQRKESGQASKDKMGKQ